MKRYARPIIDGKNLYEYFLEHKNVNVLMLDSEGNNDLVSVTYMHMGVDWTLPYILDARGIIINKEGYIIGRPYKKFFNYGQLNNIPFIDDKIKELSNWDYDQSFETTEKLDGSLVNITYYDKTDDLIVASSGMIDGEYANKFKDYIYKNLNDTQLKNLKDLAKTYTIMAEYVSPDNQIVLKYDKTDIILHGLVNTYTGKELSYNEVKAFANELGFSVAKNFPNLDSLEKVLDYVKNTDGIEGVVVTFTNGKKLKFKNDSYIEMHNYLTYFDSNKLITVSNIYKLVELIANGKYDDYVSLLNENMYNNILVKALSYLSNIYFNKLEECLKVFNEIKENIYIDTNGTVKLHNRKEVYTGVKNSFLAFSMISNYSDYLNLYKKTKDLSEFDNMDKKLYRRNWLRLKLFEKDYNNNKLKSFEDMSKDKLASIKVAEMMETEINKIKKVFFETV